MTTIAQGEIRYTFAALLPKVTFGNSDATQPGPGAYVAGGNVPNPAANIGTRPDTATSAAGGPISAVSVNRDGSVIGSNGAGGKTAIAAETHGELVPFNTKPKPLAASSPASAKTMPLSPKALGWIGGIALAVGLFWFFGR